MTALVLWSARHACNRSRLAGVEATRQQDEKPESNAVELPLHKILPSGLDGESIHGLLAPSATNQPSWVATVVKHCNDKELIAANPIDQ